MITVYHTLYPLLPTLSPYFCLPPYSCLSLTFFSHILLTVFFLYTSLTLIFLSLPLLFLLLFPSLFSPSLSLSLFLPITLICPSHSVPPFSLSLHLPQICVVESSRGIMVQQGGLKACCATAMSEGVPVSQCTVCCRNICVLVWKIHR